MSVAPHAGIVDFGTFKPPSGGLDGIQGEVPKPLVAEAGFVLSTDGWVAPSAGSGTVTNVSALTIGTAGTDLSSSVADPTTTPVITLNVPTASAVNRGALSAADWSTFNAKQSAITPAALTRVDDTNVTLTLGGTPTTALLSAASITAGWTGQLAIARGGTGKSTSQEGLAALYGYTTTDAGSWTGLSNTSTVNQIITGTGPLNISLPVVSTLAVGWRFEIFNDCSAGLITVLSSGGNTVATLGAGRAALFQCVSTSGTGAASWTYNWSGFKGTTSFPTLNQSTTGSAATLTTPRAIYGNNFDGSAALTQVIASTFGGTGNGFTKFSGPTTSEKTFTLPNATATILTSNAAVTVAQGGSGATTLTGYLKGNGTSAFTASATIPASDIGSGTALTKTDDTNVTLTLGGAPTTALLTAASLTLGWTGTLASSRGGTGNGFTKFSGPTTSEKTFTLPDATCSVLTDNATVTVAQGGSGAATLTGYLKGNGTSAFTASATIPASDIGSGAALTKTDDTNVTLTLGGSPTTALLAAASITAGWTGTLAASRGGTGLSSLGAGVATWLGTPSSANLAAAVTGETGSGALVFADGPTLTTPALGVATATSVNKVAITAPASSATLTIADGKTLTASNSITLAGTDSTTMTFPPASASIGYLNIPQNSQSAAYTTVLADSGKHIFHPSTDTNARTFTIDSNANVAYAVGTAITFVNMTANVVTIAITSDTLYLAGAGTTGSRSLAQYGVATALKMTSTTWIISGSGLT